MIGSMLHQVDMAQPFIVRLLLVALFPLSAFDKLIHWRSAVRQANRRLPRLGAGLVATGIAVELGCVACVLLGWHQDGAALLLALFCLLTAMLYHPFWLEKDYWTDDGGRARVEFWEFLKDLSVAGGLLLYASMVDTRPLSDVVVGMMP